MKHSDMVERVENYLAAYNARDADRILELYASDATMEDPVGAPPARGAEAIRALYHMGFEMGIRVELDGRIRTAGDNAVFPVCATTATGKLYVIDLFEFDENDKIARMRAFWSLDNVEGEMDL